MTEDLSELARRAYIAPQPNYYLELSLLEAGCDLVAGVDEVGSGCLAGPLVAAAAIFPPEYDVSWLSKVNDSKKLSRSQRELLVPYIRQAAIGVGLGWVEPERLDAIGIMEARLRALNMAYLRARKELQVVVGAVIDDERMAKLRIEPSVCVNKADSLSISVAAASIVAKVVRDDYMRNVAAKRYPGYGFERHVGYGTPEHLRALDSQGPCKIHRFSFAPVARALEAQRRKASADSR